MELESEDQARSILIGVNVFETEHRLVKKEDLETTRNAAISELF